MRSSTVVSIILAAIIGGVVGYVVHTNGHGGPGPIDDHNPVGFNLSPPASTANATPVPAVLTAINDSQRCTGKKQHCFVTIEYVRTQPHACNAGDTDASCQPPQCPQTGACYVFSGPVSISHIDPKLRHHTVDQITQAAGMIVLQPQP